MFSHNSFSKTSFSLTSYHGAQQDNATRSGYWRLFFYQMQEKALQEKTVEEPKVEEVVVKENIDGSATVTDPLLPIKSEKQRKTKVQKQPHVKTAQPTLTYPLPAPVKTQPNVLDIAWQATLYVRGLVAKGQGVAIQLERDLNERRKRRNKDIELLLLFM